MMNVKTSTNADPGFFKRVLNHKRSQSRLDQWLRVCFDRVTAYREVTRFSARNQPLAVTELGKKRSSQFWFAWYIRSAQRAELNGSIAKFVSPAEFMPQ
jgi:hypothetical protein